MIPVARHLPRHLLLRLLALFTCAALAFAAVPSAAQSGPSRFDRPALDSMLAPIALYPDALLSHVLMASTYPEEVQEAATWLRARPGLSGDAAVRSSADQDWDPSVRSLLAFPMVLETMASHARWTEDLGYAFLNQRAEVMDTVQALRRRAYDAGTLRSNEAIRVTFAAGGIVIEQAAPETVHVPYYDPRVVYGGWWWPASPPVYWPRWHGYVDPYPRGRYFAWGPSIYVGSGFFFGGFVWPRHEVRVVHVHSHYYPRRVVAERHVVHGRRDPVIVHRDARPGVWRHDDWRRHRDRDGDHDRRHARRDDDRHDGRRDDDRRDGHDGRRNDDRRSTAAVRRPGDVPVERQLDSGGGSDRARRIDRNNDGRPDWDRAGSDRNREDSGDRRHGTNDVRRGDRGDDRNQWRTQRLQEERERPRSVQSERERPRSVQSEREGSRSVQTNREGPRSMHREREAPRAVERAERPAPPARQAEPQSAAREARPAPRARVDPSNRD